MVTTPITTPPSTPHVLHNKPVVAMCISPWPCTCVSMHLMHPAGLGERVGVGHLACNLQSIAVCFRVERSSVQDYVVISAHESNFHSLLSTPWELEGEISLQI